MLKGWEHENHQAVVKEGAAPTRSPVYFGVPRDEWVEVESVRDAVARLQDRFIEDGVRVGATNITQGHSKKFGVEFRYTVGATPRGNEAVPSTSFQELLDKVPASVTGVAGRGTESERRVEGIPVNVKKTQTGLNAKYDDSYRPVPGGCQFETEEGKPATLGLPVHDDQNNNAETMLTCAHAFYDPDVHECRQPENVTADYIGSVDASDMVYDSPTTNGKSLFDAAKFLITTTTDIEWTTALPYGQYESKYFTGSMSRDSWYYKARNSTDITKQGRTTGISSGEVLFVNDTSFDADLDYAGGDSGGPYWDPQWDGRLAGGIHRGHDDGNAEGTQLAAIEDRFRVTA